MQVLVLAIEEGASAPGRRWLHVIDEGGYVSVQADCSQNWCMDGQTMPDQNDTHLVSIESAQSHCKDLLFATRTNNTFPLDKQCS
jgi:hypothetical protein